MNFNIFNQTDNINMQDIANVSQEIDTELSISSREALKDKIHEIHNFLRNNGVGYGMNALKVFNIFYALKKIEDKGLIEKVNFKESCKFSKLLAKANENKDEEITYLILKHVLDAIHVSKIRDFLFYEIPKTIKDGVCTHLIKEIDKIVRWNCY